MLIRLAEQIVRPARPTLRRCRLAACRRDEIAHHLRAERADGPKAAKAQPCLFSRGTRCMDAMHPRHCRAVKSYL